jgi:preprotein translocase subunit SecA
MTQAATKYQVLFDSLRSRRRKPVLLKGLDKLAARTAVAAKNARMNLAWLRRQAEMVDTLAPSMRNHSEAALAEALSQLRERFVRGRQDEETVRRALAATREAARREIGEEPYIVQLMGALALYNGRIVQMLTGEGKTLTGSIAAPLIAWQHKHLHVFTTNDYLAKRDAESRSPIYRRCGLTVGSIQQEHPPDERQGIYARSIIYGTPKQITADYLRDQIGLGVCSSAWMGRRRFSAGNAGPGPMVPGLRACLVDEADAVLIDEAVVPLIIARTRGQDEMADVYRQAAAVAARLDPRTDFRTDHLRRRVELTRQGSDRCAELTEPLDEPIWRAQRRAQELVRQALVARVCYLHGRQYQIVDGRVVIVDEFTGRFLADRSWEHGLHQAVEAKEGIDITADRETLARMSFQRFYRMYPFMCGMTGTAADGTVEMETVYQRKVTVIPTNRPIARVAWPSRAFKTSEARWNAVVESIEAVHKTGRPVLVGTRSIHASELLGGKLAARGLEHRVLNANFDKEEATIIGRAGEHRSIVVATNMAGRGTDIKLDLRARNAGGLHVILTEMHGAQRIDRQFIGRAGRQGDPGSSQMFVSLEDELVKLHTPRLAPLVRALAAALGTGQDELAGPGRALALALFRAAQRAGERRDRSMRAEVMRQDDWVEKHLPGM